MANVRDVTTLDHLTELKQDGYVLAIQDGDIYAMPKDVWDSEIRKEYAKSIEEFEQWYETVKGTIDSNDIPVYLVSSVADLQVSMANVESDIEDINNEISTINNTLTNTIGVYEKYLTPGPVKVNNSNIGVLLSKTFEKGIYVVTLYVNFGTCRFGDRSVSFSTTRASMALARGYSSQRACEKTATLITLTRIMNIEKPTTYYLNVLQDSGFDIGVTGGLEYVRIK